MNHVVKVRKGRQSEAGSGWAGDWQIGGQVQSTAISDGRETVTLFGTVIARRRVLLGLASDYTISVNARQVELQHSDALDHSNPTRFDLGHLDSAAADSNAFYRAQP